MEYVSGSRDSQSRVLAIMGGAIPVPGNLGDGGLFKTDNKSAEWNPFCDPLAARIVFESGARIDLVPLDATAKAPIDMAFLKELRRFVVQVLETDSRGDSGRLLSGVVVEGSRKEGDRVRVALDAHALRYKRAFLGALR